MVDNVVMIRLSEIKDTLEDKIWRKIEIKNGDEVGE